MAPSYDPEFAEVLKRLLPHMPKRDKLDLETIPSARQQRESGIGAAFNRLPDSPDVESNWHYAKAKDGHSIPIQAFVKKGPKAHATPAVIHFHGGGMILGSSSLFAKALAGLVTRTSVPIFSVDYRLAPEHKGEVIVEDCYSAISWLYENSSELNIDKSRIGLFGESAGGGLVVGASLLARDRKLDPPLAKQILVYPMLDDRNTIPNPVIEPMAFWKTEDNAVAWSAVLGNAGSRTANTAVSPYVAPAQATNLQGLPPAYIDVGTLDIFRDENIEYARRLLAEDINVELHVYSGLPHAWEMIAPDISATRVAIDNRVRAILSI